MDAGGPGRGKGGPGGDGAAAAPSHLRPRAGGAAPALTAPLGEEKGGQDTRPASEDIFGLRPPPRPGVSPLGDRSGPGLGSLPAVPPPPAAADRPLAAVCARIFVVVMRVDECEVGGHLPFPSGLAKKKKLSAAASGGQRQRQRPRRRFPRRPRLPFPEAGGCARAQGPPATQAERAARARDNTAGSPGPGVRAHGAWACGARPGG